LYAAPVAGQFANCSDVKRDACVTQKSMIEQNFTTLHQLYHLG